MFRRSSSSTSILSYYLRYFVIITAILSTTIYTTQNHFVIELLNEESINYAQKNKTFIEKDIDSLLHLTEGVAYSMAQYAAKSKLDDESFKNVLPKFLDVANLSDVIAGGGIWPLPYKFDENMERNSYFWGKDKYGNLEFVNDYNNPETPPYYKEEWFVPAKYSSEDHCYWSKSYTDAYTKEAMITCSVPIYRNSQLWGVSTVDLSLGNMSIFIKELLSADNGYAFIVDRNNRFITHPQTEHVQKIEDGTPVFITLDEYIKKNPEFSAYKEHIRSKTDKKPLSLELRNLAIQIQKEARDVEMPEAIKIAQLLGNNKRVGADKLHHKIKEDAPVTSAYDPFLRTDSHIVTGVLDESFWSIYISIPPSKKMATNQEFIKEQQFLSITIIVISMMALFAALYNKTAVPWTTVSKTLRKITRNPETQVEHTSPAEISAISEINYIEETHFNLSKILVEMHEALMNQHNDKNNESNDKAKKQKELSAESSLNGVLGFIKSINTFKKELIKNSYIQQLDKTKKSLILTLEDLSSIAQMEAGLTTSKKEPVSVEKTMQNICSRLKDLSHDRNVNIHINTVEDMPECIVVDNLWTQQALFHVMHNAIRFTEAGDIQVNISIAPNADHHSENHMIITFNIVNQGVLSASNDALFSKDGYDSTQIGDYRMTRMGLLVAHNVATTMNGSLTLTQETSNSIKTTLSIPVGIAKTPDFSLYEGESLPLFKENDQGIVGKILIVDDNPCIADAICERLGKLGFLCDKAYDAPTAQDLIYTNFYHVAFIDQRMHSITGSELASCLDANKFANKRLTIALMVPESEILLTNTQLPETIHQYILKPVKLNDLLLVAHTALNMDDDTKPCSLNKKLNCMYDTPLERSLAINQSIAKNTISSYNSNADALADFDSAIVIVKHNVRTMIASIQQGASIDEVKPLFILSKQTCHKFGLKRILFILNRSSDMLTARKGYQSVIALQYAIDALENDYQLMRDYF